MSSVLLCNAKHEVRHHCAIKGSNGTVCARGMEVLHYTSMDKRNIYLKKTNSTDHIISNFCLILQLLYDYLVQDFYYLHSYHDHYALMNSYIVYKRLLLGLMFLKKNHWMIFSILI